jgi:hypothetical protein
VPASIMDQLLMVGWSQDETHSVRTILLPEFR